MDKSGRSQDHVSNSSSSCLTIGVLPCFVQAKVRFDLVSETGSIVNHIKGSQNLSNKASLQMMPQLSPLESRLR